MRGADLVEQRNLSEHTMWIHICELGASFEKHESCAGRTQPKPHKR